MYRILIASTLISSSMAGFAQAGEWTRITSGPSGTSTTTTNRDCIDGACSFTSSTTGPNGGVYSRSGSASRTGAGEYSFERSGTGPAGRSWSRNGTLRFRR